MSRLYQFMTDAQLKTALDGGYNIISMDFGDGECAAVIYNPKTSTFTSLFVDGGGANRKLMTVIFIPDDDNTPAVIGESAISYTAAGIPGNLYANFKCMPEFADDYAESEYTAVSGKARTKGEVMRLFVKCFLNALFEFNTESGALSTAKETILFIGRPSSPEWEQSQRAYQELLGRGLKVNSRPVLKLIAVSESAAALASLMWRTEMHEHFNKTIDCHDSGSSTYDYVRLKAGSTVSEHSINLGANLIEKMIVDHVVGQQGGAVKVSGMDYINVRSAKERYFGNNTDLPPQTQVALLRISSPTEKRERSVSVVLDVNLMRSITHRTPIDIADRTQLSGVSHYPSWNDAHISFCNAMRANGAPLPSRILLTGGASHMPFEIENLKRVYPGSVIEHSKEPSYTVARGLAWITWMELKTEKALRAVSEYIPGVVKKCLCGESELLTPEGLIQDRDKPGIMTLANRLANDMAAALLKNVIEPTLSLWKDRRSDYITLNAVVEAINKQGEKYIASAEYKAHVRAVVDAWFSGLKNDIMKSVNAKLSEVFSYELPESCQLTLPVTIYDSIMEGIDRLKVNINAENFFNRVLGMFGFGLVRFDYDHSVGDRKSLFDNFMKMNPDGLLYGFKTALFKQSVEGLAYSYRSDIYRSLMLNIKHRLYSNLTDDISIEVESGIEALSMYIYIQLTARRGA